MSEPERNPFWPGAPLPTVDEADPRQARLAALIADHNEAKASLQEAFALITADPDMPKLVQHLSGVCAVLHRERLELVQDMAGHNRATVVVPQVRIASPATPTHPEKPVQLSF